MLEFDGINYWAVLMAWAVYCAVGAFWYSSAGFAKKWEEYTKVNIMNIPEKEATKILISVVASSLIQALTLAVILNSLHVSNIVEGIIVTTGLWLGLVTATTVGVTLYSRRSWSLIWLNSSYFLVVMLASSVLLVLWD